MLDQHTRNHQHPRSLGPTHRIASTQPWIEPTTRALRRAQPPPAPRKERVRHDLRFWGYFALTAVLATLVPVTAALGVNIADSTWFRVLVAIAISAAAALAVLASSCASAHAAPVKRRRERRTH